MIVSKNDAYLAWSEWGEALQLKDVERITKVYPDLDRETAETYVAEFKALAALTNRLAEAGGSVKNKSAAMERYVQARFPFLEESGMRNVMTRVDYYAWHDGYHDSPMGTVDLSE